MADINARMVSLSTFAALVLMAFRLFHQAEGLSEGISVEQLQYFSSKTRYFQRYESFAGVPKSDLCVPRYIDVVARHGTRFPSKSDVGKIEKMLKRVNAVFGSRPPFRSGDLTLPVEASPFSETQDKLLSPIGEDEIYNLSRRLREKFESLFDVPYSTDRFSFISTGTTRTTQSAMAFAYGLFEEKGRLGSCKFQPVALESSKIENDPLLRFFDLCPKYERKVSENKTSLYEFDKFKQSLPMQEVIENVASRIQVNSSALSPSDVVAMFVACTFEVALHSNTNNWCTIFDVDDLQVLEYLYDLKHFWKRGYGYEITYKIACALLSDIYQSVQNASSLENGHTKRGVFRFAHGETLQPLFALLGLFKDSEKLRADNFHEIRVTQQYKTSKISPFGANIVFVLYNCSSGEDNETDQFKVQVFVNEELVTLPGCGNESMCPLETFLHHYLEPVQMCDLKEHCKIEMPADSQEQANNHVEL